MSQINLEKSVKQKSIPTHDPPEEWKVTQSFDNNIGKEKNTPKIVMSQGNDSDNDYHQEINERADDFNCCNKETPAKVYSEVELAQKIVSDTKTPAKEDSLTSFAGEIFHHFAQRAIQIQGLNNHKVKLDNPQNDHTHVNKVYDTVHINMSEDSRVMNLLRCTKEFSDTDYIRVNLLKTSVEIPLPADFDNLEVVESKTGDKSFGHNYSNYFAEILKKLNPHCSFKFFYNHVRDLNSKKKSAPIFCVKIRCMMEECQVEVAIKQFIENNIPQKSLLITFNCEVKHRIGNLKAKIYH